MGDDIGSGSVTGCRLRLLGNHRQHTELPYVGRTKIKARTDVITHSLPSVAFWIVLIFFRDVHKFPKIFQRAQKVAKMAKVHQKNPDVVKIIEEITCE